MTPKAASAQDSPAPGGNPAKSLAVGLIVGVDLIGRAVAISAVIFTGAAVGGIGSGTMLMILASFLACAAIALRQPGHWGALGAVQQAPLAVLLPVFFGLAAMPDDPATARGATATVFALLACTALLTGAVMLALSFLKLDRVVRLMPYPVSAGFLAATGALLVMAALLGATDSDRLRELNLTGQLPLLLTVGFAALLGVLRRLMREAGLVFGLITATVVFYIALDANGIALDSARATGLLPAIPPDTARMAPSPALIAAVDLQVLVAAVPAIVAAAMISVLGLILNIAGLELAMRREISTSQALQTFGVTNLALGAVGSSVAYPSSTTSLTAQLMGADHRALGIGVLATLALGFFFIGDVVSFVPGFVSGGLLMFIGASIVSRWFLLQRPKQTWADWLLAGSIVAISILLGMLQAIVFGILAASLIFAFSYGRLPVIARISDLGMRRSAVDRGPTETRRLDRHAAEVVTLALDGFLFFGSTEPVVAEIRSLFRDRATLRTVILDMERVRGIDSAALAALGKVEHLAERHGARVVIAGAKPQVIAALDRQNLAMGSSGLVRANTADAALSEAEDRILARLPAPNPDGAVDALTLTLGDADQVQAILALMTERRLDAGSRLIAAGDTDASDIYLLDRGRLGVYAPGADGNLRVRVLRPGAFVGEIATYAGLPRTADVIAEVDSIVYVLPAATLERVTSETPDIAAAIHRLIATTLADKLHRTTQMLRDRA